ncbi:MAG: alpha/beta hydrolase [Pedosphaera sp.]|nr:alpha/beta hydrolase [Pedosphaera sp.]
MKRSVLFSFAVIATLFSVVAEPVPPIPVWPGTPPGAQGISSNDIPTLTPFLPAAGLASGAAMIICPGGGYWVLAPHEGQDYALFLARQGLTCFVLKYRLAQHGYHHPVMMQDVQRAVRTIRSRAAEWKVDPSRIGVMGSSAGGHLTSTALTHFDAGRADASDPIDRVSCRPDLGVLCYAVISMGEFTHGGSKKNLLGDKPSTDLVWLMSNELQVTPQTPPCFVWHTAEDSAVPVENALLFAAALQRAKVPFDLHIFEKGRHGLGLDSKPPEFLGTHPWGADLVFWLHQRGWTH